MKGGASRVNNLRGRDVGFIITLYSFRDLKGWERREVLSIKPPSRGRSKDR